MYHYNADDNIFVAEDSAANAGFAYKDVDNFDVPRLDVFKRADSDAFQSGNVHARGA